jgi:hypothetical protein
MPSVSKAVVIIRVRRETARGASARAIARKIRAEEAIEIVVRVDPVLIDAVVSGQDVTVWSVTSGRGDRQQVRSPEAINRRKAFREDWWMDADPGEVSYLLSVSDRAKPLWKTPAGSRLRVCEHWRWFRLRSRRGFGQSG